MRIHHVTPDDIGRVIRKRATHSRRFLIIDVQGDAVTLADEVFIGIPVFTLTDLRTYEWIGSAPNGEAD